MLNRDNSKENRRRWKLSSGGDFIFAGAPFGSLAAIISLQ
jgi:hypothetical protein